MEMLTIDGLTLEQHIKKELKPHIRKFWGSEYKVKPVIHPLRFGDGLQLCYLGTINQRPNYWLILIDSSIDISEDDFDYEKHLLDPLEDEFGRTPGFFIDRHEFIKLKKKQDRSVEDWENYREYKRDCQYPRLDWEGGHYGSIVNFGIKKT